MSGRKRRGERGRSEKRKAVSANVAPDTFREERKGRVGDDIVWLWKVGAPHGGLPGLFTRLLQTLVDRRPHSILLNASVSHGCSAKSII